MKDTWVGRWVYTTNHRDIGILYFTASFFFGLIGGTLAMLMRTQLSAPLNNLLTESAYNQAVTLHGLLMILWFLSPLGIAFGNYFVPLQIGAADMALPRLNAMSFWMFVISGFMAIAAFFMPGGNASAGWTSYAPLATSQYTPGPGPTLAFGAILLLCVSITITGINFILTIVYERAPGITWRKLPMFTWFMLFMIIQALFAFDSLLTAVLLLMSDRVLGTFYFVSSAGGALLWDNLFWFFGHPEVYVVLLPAFGLIAEVLPVFSSRPLPERSLIIVLTGAVIVPLSYLVWAHHMFITGINLSEDQAFSISTILISLPFDLVTLAFVKTLTNAYIRLSVPMLFAIGAIMLFVIGGVAGVFLSSYVLDSVFKGTFFVVAHFHYVMVGASIFGLFGGLYYYLPRLTGRLYNEALGRVHFIISMIGFNILYFPMFLLYDMPRRIYTYQPNLNWNTLNYVATVGGYIFALAQVLLIVNIFYTMRRGPISPPNPWGAITLEWTPTIMGGSPATDAQASSYSADPIASATPAYAADAATPITAPPPSRNYYSDDVPHAEYTSVRPLQITLGAAISIFGIALLTYNYLGGFVLALGIAILALSLAYWAWDDLNDRFRMPARVTETWPFNNITKMKLGMWFFLATEIFIFGAILTSDIYVRINSPSWPAPWTIQDIPTGLWSSVALLTSALTMLLALESIKKGNQRGLIRWLEATFILGGAFIVLHAYEWYELLVVRSPPFTWTNGLPGSTYFFTVGLHGAHVTVGLIIILYLMVKARRGGYSSDNYTGIQNFTLFWLFVDIVWMFLFPYFYLL